MEKHAFLTYKPGNQRASFQALYFHFESNKMKPVVEVQLDKRAAATLEEVGGPLTFLEVPHLSSSTPQWLLKGGWFSTNSI